MRNRQLTRWCDVCKMRVMSLHHEHGQSAQGIRPMPAGMSESADVNRAFEEAQDHIHAAKEAADKESQRILNDRLTSAVERVK